MTFFGLAGMASVKSGAAPVTSIVLAVVAGLAAMVGVHRLMLLLSQLREDGTFRIKNALGQRGLCRHARDAKDETPEPARFHAHSFLTRVHVGNVMPHP